MLGEYLKFNDVVFPRPTSNSMQSKTIENVTQSEAGDDLVTVVRSSKKSWSFSFDLSSRTKDVLEALCKAEYTMMYFMGQTYKVRVRDFQSKLVDGSEWLTTTEGLFTCSVKVTEY